MNTLTENKELVVEFGNVVFVIANTEKGLLFRMTHLIQSNTIQAVLDEEDVLKMERVIMNANGGGLATTEQATKEYEEAIADRDRFREMAEDSVERLNELNIMIDKIVADVAPKELLDNEKLAAHLIEAKNRFA